MRRIKLLIFLSLASLQLTFFVAAQGPTHPELKRRERPSTSVDKTGKWNREQTKDNVKRAPERESTEKNSTTREERPGGRPKTRDKASAWDRRLQRTDKTSKGSLTESERRTDKQGGRDKARKWESSRPQIGRELKPSQRPKFIEHLFGGMKKKGQVEGFHYEGAPNRATDGTKVLKITQPPDARGIYKAKVEVRGKEKEHQSTFFPRAWSRAEVLKAVDEAYANCDPVAGKSPNYREGKSSDGMTIGMLFNRHEEIVSAFPIYGK